MAEYLAIAQREAHQEHERLKIEQQLRDSQKMEATGRLVGGIAHDFNNLLTGMMIYCVLLEIALGKEHRLQKHVHELRAAGERGAELVGQLLALTSQQVLEPEVMSINEVLLQSEDMMRRLIGEDILLAVRCADDLKFTRVDPGQLQQVILNLAINARDAMPSGGQLWVETSNYWVDREFALAHPGLSPGPHVLLAVSDNGGGIDKETLAHIFEPFFTTKEQGKGTGLGLAMVNGIVKQHHGHIAVESVLDEGFTFRIFLPSVEDEAPAKPIPGARLEEPLVRPAGQKLLLVEDDELVRPSLVDALLTNGYEVLEATNGDDALNVLARHPGVVHLMITDLIMPGMGGAELAQRLHANWPATKVLFITGYSDDPRTRQLMGEGVEFLGKPFSPWSLMEKISGVLQRKEPASPEPTCLEPSNMDLAAARQ